MPPTRIKRGSIIPPMTGPGIGPDIVSRVFEPFYRGDAYRPQDAANGLGLPIARLIVERMRGSITIQSNHPSGTSVEIKLPVSSKS
jgi:signal transduction histidine kinase